MAAAPYRPLTLRLLGLGNRLAYRLSGGRAGALEPGKSAPKGRVLRLITAIHLRLYTLTGGFLGGNTERLPTLLLTTTGRKSGLPRTVPLPHFPHPDGWIVVASFAGNPRNPAWYDNLVANPEVTVQENARVVRAVARTATGEERRALWQKIALATSIYEDYQAVTEREIPLVVLRSREEL